MSSNNTTFYDLTANASKIAKKTYFSDQESPFYDSLSRLCSFHGQIFLQFPIPNSPFEPIHKTTYEIYTGEPLVVSTHLKNNISQIGSFPQVGVKKIFETTT